MWVLDTRVCDRHGSAAVAALQFSNLTFGIRSGLQCIVLTKRDDDPVNFY